MKTCAEWRYSSTVFHLRTRWLWVVSFMPQPLYLQGKSLGCPWCRRLSASKSPFWRCGEENNLLTLPEIKPRPSSPSLYNLSYSSYANKEQEIVTGIYVRTFLLFASILSVMVRVMIIFLRAEVEKLGRQPTSPTILQSTRLQLSWRGCSP
jgi:hypothetical protein